MTTGVEEGEVEGNASVDVGQKEARNGVHPDEQGKTGDGKEVVTGHSDAVSTEKVQTRTTETQNVQSGTTETQNHNVLLVEEKAHQEEQPLMNKGTASVPSTGGGASWGWGGWGAMVAVIQDVATEATAAARGIAEKFDEEEKAAMQELERREGMAAESGGASSSVESTRSLVQEVVGTSRAAVGGVPEGSAGEQVASAGLVSGSEEPDHGDKAEVINAPPAVQHVTSSTSDAAREDQKGSQTGSGGAGPGAKGSQDAQIESPGAVVDALAGKDRIIEELKVEAQQNSVKGLETEKAGLEPGGQKQASTDFDRSVEGLTANAMSAWASAWKGGINLVHALEHQAETLATTIQEGKLTAKAQALAPQLLEGGKGFAEQGLKMLEYVGKETVDILAQETGIELEKEEDGGEKAKKAAEEEAEEEYVPEEEIVNFYHCYYIYGGPEHLEELEALASHHELLCNRFRAKLAEGDARSAYDELAKRVRSLLTLPDAEARRARAAEGSSDKEGKKGKSKVVTVLDVDMEEVASVKASSIGQAADLASRFTPGTLAGLPPAEVTQKTTDRLDAIRTEGVHRVSELCAVCTQHLLQIGNALISSASSATEGGSAPAAGATAGGEEGAPAGVSDVARWAEESTGRAEAARERACQLADDIEAVVRSFVTGMKDIVAAFQVAAEAPPAAAAQDASGEVGGKAPMEARMASLEGELEDARAAAHLRLQDGLLRLMYIILSTTHRS